MIMVLRKPLAFLVKDVINDTTYKLAFLFNFVNGLFIVFVFYFLSSLVGDAASPHLESYGGNYFSFALIGIIAGRFFSASLHSLRRFVRESQLNGTFEVALSTQTSALMTVFSSMLYSFVFTTVEAVISFSVASFLFDFSVYWSNLPVALLVLFLGVISFTSLGILSAGFIIIFKRGDPISQAIQLGTQLLAGEVYPVTVLPGFLQVMAWLLPVTHALEGIRLALLQNYSLTQLAPNIMALSIMSAVLIPTSILWFNYAIKRAKIDGSLSHY